MLSEEFSTQWYRLYVKSIKRSMNIHNYIKWKSMIQPMFNIIDTLIDRELSYDHNSLVNFDVTFENQILWVKNKC